MTIAVLAEFTLHLDQRRIEMRRVKVVKAGDNLFLLGRIVRETEAVASGENSNLVFKTENRSSREAILKLIGTHNGQIAAFEKNAILGFVIFDHHTGARKLPVFMRKLLGVP